MHPTPSQQNALLTAIYNNTVRPPLTLTQYRYYGVPVYILRELPNDEAIVQTVNMQKELPVPGLHGATNYHMQARVKRGLVMPLNVVAHVRSADVGSVFA